MEFTSYGDGRLTKMEVDYTKQVDEAIAKSNDTAKKGKIVEAVESLAQLEKQTRFGYDSRSNSRLLCHMVQLAFDGNAWKLLNDTIIALCKKRALIKYAIKNMVQLCCEVVDKIQSDEIKNQLIETLRTVTAGKIYVEVERARLTKRVVDRLEQEGKVEEARVMIMEMQVETFGSMEIKEKVQYLLHQMRLSIAQDDFLRASVVSRKISTKFFEGDNDEIQNMRLEYYKYMIQISLNDSDYLDVCKHYQQIFQTPKIKEDQAKTIDCLKCMVLYVLLAPHTNEQWDLLHRINLLRELELVPEYKALLGIFINQEIIGWKETVLSRYEPILRHGAAGSPEANIFGAGEAGDKMFKRLHECVGEHNVRMVTQYYDQVTFERMAQLLEFPLEEMEKFVCNLIVTGVTPDVKIHRPLRVIKLKARRENIETLDQWGSNVKKLTGILNKVTHLIHKEEMVYKHLHVHNGF